MLTNSTENTSYSPRIIRAWTNNWNRMNKEQFDIWYSRRFLPCPFKMPWRPPKAFSARETP